MTGASREGDRIGRWLGDLVRAGQWHRRLLAAGLLAGAVAAGLQALEPPPPATTAVVAAARDLTAGARLTLADLTVIRLGPGLVPDGALRGSDQARGHTLVSPVRRGEPLTDVRLLGPAALGQLGPGLVATPVRLADAESVRLLRAGDVVDVLAAGATETAPPQARLVAAAVRVLTVPRTGGARFGGAIGEGGLILLATTSSTAARLAAAAVTDRLSVVLLGDTRW